VQKGTRVGSALIQQGFQNLFLVAVSCSLLVLDQQWGGPNLLHENLGIQANTRENKREDGQNPQFVFINFNFGTIVSPALSRTKSPSAEIVLLMSRDITCCLRKNLPLTKSEGTIVIISKNCSVCIMQ
jgi:hypothetical protein